MGHNQVMVGSRPRYALLWLATVSSMGKYEDIQGRISSGDTEVLSFSIRLTEARYDDGSRPSLPSAGYFWTVDDEWYGRSPVAAHVVADLRAILQLHDVPLPS